MAWHLVAEDGGAYRRSGFACPMRMCRGPTLSSSTEHRLDGLSLDEHHHCFEQVHASTHSTIEGFPPSPATTIATQMLPSATVCRRHKTSLSYSHSRGNLQGIDDADATWHLNHTRMFIDNHTRALLRVY